MLAYFNRFNNFLTIVILILYKIVNDAQNEFLSLPLIAVFQQNLIYCNCYFLEAVMQEGFDKNLYIRKQKENILKRIKHFDGKLYLEFGGKLFDDFHASRVLPGFNPNCKIQLLQELKDQAEIIICISARDIERKKVRADFGISYDQEVLRLIDTFRGLDLLVSGIVITLFDGQPSAIKFQKSLERRGEKVYIHKFTKGYPSDINKMVSDDGYGANPFVKTSRPLVVVTAPGPCSGKLATCLSQMYHEYKRGKKAGYAKFETFPIWNLSLKHPVNIAYEAATADLKDINMIDYFHYDAYEKVAVNYNRDLETFPVLKNILKKITGQDIYKSPTDMGVNMVGYGIVNDQIVRDASKKEIVRRYHNACCDYKKGITGEDTVERCKMLMSELELNEDFRSVRTEAVKLSKDLKLPVVSIELEDGRVVSGKDHGIISASSGAVLNALKTLAGIDDSTTLIAKHILDPIADLRTKTLGMRSKTLSLKETLIALSICSSFDQTAKKAFDMLAKLQYCDAHSSHILCGEEENLLKSLRISITSEACFPNSNLYM